MHLPCKTEFKVIFSLFLIVILVDYHMFLGATIYLFGCHSLDLK